LTRDRVLVWDGCVNVRDLGGLPLEDGGATQFGVAVRADSVAGLTEAGWEALLEYGVTRVIDLRGDHERSGGEPRVPVVRVPITPSSGPAWDWPSMREAYLAMLDEWRPQFTRVIDEMAAAAEPVVVHCHGGRDRTGLAVALLLDATGVRRSAIAADHARSDESWAPYNPSWIEQATDPAERAKRLRITEPAGETMVEVLAEVDRRYGGANDYIRSASLDTLMLRLRGATADSQ
jgi:protein-tyrosine phosphatase